MKKNIEEEGVAAAPANSVGGGNIAGVGVPNPSKPSNWAEPGVGPASRRKHHLRNKKGAEARNMDLALFRRKAVVAEEMTEPKLKRGRFAGNDTFILPRMKYNDFLGKSKKDRQWWKTYMGEDEGTLDEVRTYASKNPKAPIIFEDEDTGACFYARYGKKS